MNMNEICEMCNKGEGKKYTKPGVLKVCLDCLKKYKFKSHDIVDLHVAGKYIGTYREVKFNNVNDLLIDKVPMLKRIP